jgi:hypothetical protein
MANATIKETSAASVAPETPKAVEAVQPAMSTEQLLTLVASMQQQLIEVQKQAAAASAAQTDAILKLAEPKEALKSARDLANEANDKQFKDQQREQERRTKANNKFAQDNCEHIAGCSPLSESKDIANRTSIIWHRGDVGQTTGICTVCQRIFKQSDPDFYQWRKKKSFNKDSASGFRTVMDPLAAIELSYLHDIE